MQNGRSSPSRSYALIITGCTSIGGIELYVYFTDQLQTTFVGIPHRNFPLPALSSKTEMSLIRKIFKEKIAHSFLAVGRARVRDLVPD